LLHWFNLSDQCNRIVFKTEPGTRLQAFFNSLKSIVDKLATAPVTVEPLIVKFAAPVRLKYARSTDDAKLS